MAEGKEMPELHDDSYSFGLKHMPLPFTFPWKFQNFLQPSLMLLG
jgi:hypothetical protein